MSESGLFLFVSALLDLIVVREFFNDLGLSLLGLNPPAAGSLLSGELSCCVTVSQQAIPKKMAPSSLWSGMWKSSVSITHLPHRCCMH